MRYENVRMYVNTVHFIVLGEGMFCWGMMSLKASGSKTVGVKGNLRDYLSDISKFCLKKKGGGGVSRLRFLKYSQE